jgi:hypothetical protein
MWSKDRERSDPRARVLRSRHGSLEEAAHGRTGAMALTFGIHLPVLGWGGRPTDPRLVRDVAVRGERAGFEVLCANDHLVMAARGSTASSPSRPPAR